MNKRSEPGRESAKSTPKGSIQDDNGNGDEPDQKKCRRESDEDVNTSAASEDQSDVESVSSQANHRSVTVPGMLGASQYPGPWPNPLAEVPQQMSAASFPATSMYAPSPAYLYPLVQNMRATQPQQLAHVAQLPHVAQLQQWLALYNHLSQNLAAQQPIFQPATTEPLAAPINPFVLLAVQSLAAQNVFAFMNPAALLAAQGAVSPLPTISLSHAAVQQPQRPEVGLTGRPPVALYLTSDDSSLSEFQCLVRKQIQFFEARQEHVDSNAQGRNRPIVLAQVGIRCRYCVTLQQKHRARGAVYFPTKLDGIYQASQNMASTHLCEQCAHVPEGIRTKLNKLKDRKSSAGGGKKYWSDAARVLGVIEDESIGLRFDCAKR